MQERDGSALHLFHEMVQVVGQARGAVAGAVAVWEGVRTALV